MSADPRKISLSDWDARYAELRGAGLQEPSYGGPLARHLHDGDLRLKDLAFDNSAAALRLWNFLLTEEDRLFAARAQGKKIVGAMKDLGTVPVLAYSAPNVVAFYPDGAFWVPCVMRLSDRLFALADQLGIDDSFCPVRAMLGAFVNEAHFPIPDLLISSAGAVCDDFAAIAGRLERLGHQIEWWEMPVRREPEPDEPSAELPGGLAAPADQVEIVKMELARIAGLLGDLAGEPLNEEALTAGIRQANRVRRVLKALRRAAYTAVPAPIGALDMFIAEMLAIHYCSDRDECLAVLTDLLAEVEKRVGAGKGVLPSRALPLFVINPPADMRLMNLLEECNARVAGTDYMFCHALDEIPEDMPPLEALARTALADPMGGSAGQRAERICREAAAAGSRAALVCRIPGASHCGTEGPIIAEALGNALHIPVLEIEVPPVMDAAAASLRTRIESLIEIANHG